MKQIKPKHRQYPRYCQSGITLIEVVVALSITALSVWAIVSGYIFCARSAEKAALCLVANARAMERLEETRSAKWDTAILPVVDQLVSTNFPGKDVTLDLSGSGTGVTPAKVFTEISEVSANPPLKRIRVDCVWQFNGGQWVTNTIETCRAPDQ